MKNSNSKQWSSATPGYIIFLIDQSGSMQETCIENKNKAEFTALVINRTINELIFTNMDGDNVKDRVFISLIGYGGKGGNSVDDIRSDYISSFADQPIRIDYLKKKVSDGAGGLVEIDDEMPIFIEPVSNGLTPMGDAFAFAKLLIEGWLQKKPENPAPVIINVSDGLPFGGALEDQKSKSLYVAGEIMTINTNDGNPLIFNIHIGNGNTKEYAFIDNENEITDDQSKFLFKISSKIPEAYKIAALKHDFTVKEDSRGFVSNAQPETLIRFINFGSSGGSGADLVK